MSVWGMSRGGKGEASGMMMVVGVDAVNILWTVIRLDQEMMICKR